MSELRDMIKDSADRLLGDLVDRPLWASVEQGTWPKSAWQQLVELGLPHALLSESAGGIDLNASDAMSLLELAGYHALPLPLAENMIGNHLLATTGMAVPDGPITMATQPPGQHLELQRSGGGWLINGELRRVPWGDSASHVIASALTDDLPHLVMLPANDLAWENDINLAGEQRSTCRVNTMLLPTANVAALSVAGPSLLEWGALIRSQQMAGAMRRILELSVQYANERVQFGRPIGKFQAVQQQLAVMAGQVALSGACTDAAATALGTGNAGFAIAVAKARVGEAAGQVAAIGHQVHAAMGYTQEHTLHYSTRRLWSWRDEFGTEPYWQHRIGMIVASKGGDGLWPYLTAMTRGESNA